MEDSFRMIEKFNDKFFPGWKESHPMYLTNALAGEVGELCNLVKHGYGGGTKNVEVDPDKFLEECADVYIYLTLFIRIHGWTWEDFKSALAKKMDKNIRRMEKRNERGPTASTTFRP